MAPATTRCPTPAKARYATREAAGRAAHSASLAFGQTLRPYECPCSWWHLTSSPAPAALQPAAHADIQYLATLPAIDFREIVSADARGTAEPQHQAALRAPANLKRWQKALGELDQDLCEQLRRRRHDQSLLGHDWRKRAATYRGALTVRMTECQRLRAEAHERAQRGRETKRHDAEVAAAAGVSVSELRRRGGEVAIERLINAHGAEFSRYLAEAFTDLGLTVPDRVQRHLPAEAVAR